MSNSMERKENSTKENEAKELLADIAKNLLNLNHFITQDLKFDLIIRLSFYLIKKVKDLE